MKQRRSSPDEPSRGSGGKIAHQGKPVLDRNGPTLAPLSCSGTVVADPEGSESSRSQQHVSTAAR